MSRLINHLLQLQEMSDARAEQTTLETQRDLSELDRSIQQLLNELPRQLSVHFQRQYKRNPRVVVPLDGTACSGCGATIPPGTRQKIEFGDRAIPCDTCGRLLYTTEGLPKFLTRRKTDDSRPSHGLLRFSAPELMQPNLTAGTRDETVRELALLMQEKGYIENAEGVIEQVLRREAMASTAVGKALAFPHARTTEGGILTFSVGLHKKGIDDFNPPDNVKVKIIFFMVIPAPASAFYLRLLSGFVQSFSTAESRNKLLTGKTPEAMWETLLKLTPKTM